MIKTFQIKRGNIISVGEDENVNSKIVVLLFDVNKCFYVNLTEQIQRESNVSNVCELCGSELTCFSGNDFYGHSLTK